MLPTPKNADIQGPVPLRKTLEKSMSHGFIRKPSTFLTSISNDPEISSQSSLLKLQPMPIAKIGRSTFINAPLTARMQDLK